MKKNVTPIRRWMINWVAQCFSKGWYRIIEMVIWVFCLVSFQTNYVISLQWHDNGRDSVSNHQPHDCFLNSLFRRRSKKTSKLLWIRLTKGQLRGKCVHLMTSSCVEWIRKCQLVIWQQYLVMIVQSATPTTHAVVYFKIDRMYLYHFYPCTVILMFWVCSLSCL